MRLRLRLLSALALLVTLLVSGAAAPAQAQTPTPTPPPPPAARVLGCSADYQITSSWGTGFVAEVIVTNTGTVNISTWQVTVTLPAGTFTQGWNASYTTSGSTIIIDPMGWNSALAPGGSTPVGFIGAGDGTPSGVSVSCQT